MDNSEENRECLEVVVKEGNIIFPPSVPDPFPLLGIIKELEAKLLVKDQTIKMLRKKVNNADKANKTMQKLKDELVSSQQEVKRLKEASLVKATPKQMKSEQQPKAASGGCSLLKELVSVTCDYNRKLKEKNNADGNAKKLEESCQVLQDENNDLIKRLKLAEDNIKELKKNIVPPNPTKKSSVFKELVSMTCNFNQTLKEKNVKDGDLQKLREENADLNYHVQRLISMLQKQTNVMLKEKGEKELLAQQMEQMKFAMHSEQQPKAASGGCSLLKELVSVTCDYNRKLKEKNNADGNAKKLEESCQVLQNENNDLIKRLKLAEDNIKELKKNIVPPNPTKKSSVFKELVSMTCNFNQTLKEKNVKDGDLQKLREENADLNYHVQRLIGMLQKQTNVMLKEKGEKELLAQQMEQMKFAMQSEQQPKAASGGCSLLKELVSVTCDYNRKLKEKNNADGNAKKLEESCQVLQDENNDLIKRLKLAEDNIKELKKNIVPPNPTKKSSVFKELVSMTCNFNQTLKEKNVKDGDLQKLREENADLNYHVQRLISMLQKQTNVVLKEKGEKELLAQQMEQLKFAMHVSTKDIAILAQDATFGYQTSHEERLANN